MTCLNEVRNNYYPYRGDLRPFKCWSGFRIFSELLMSFLHGLVKACPNEKCLVIKHYQTLFGDQTFCRLTTLFGAVWSCLVVLDQTNSHNLNVILPVF